MNKLENIIQKKEYQNLITKHFDKLGFEIIDNKKQIEKFNKDFIQSGLDINDNDDYMFYQVLNKTYCFCKTEHSEFFGLYKDPKINEYTCIIKLDSECELEWMGSDCQLWIDNFFYLIDNIYVDIPKTIKEFKKDTKIFNSEIILYPEISDFDILALYDKNE